MRNEFDKCYFCKSYDEYEGCEYGCDNKESFSPDHNRIIKKAKKKENICARRNCIDEFIGE